MVKCAIAVVVVSAVAALAPGARLLAHEGHEHRILGTVTTAAADHVMVKDKEGKNLTVKVTKDTKVKASTPLKAEHIKAGTRVVITAVEGKDKSVVAKTIQAGAPPAGK